MTILAKPGQKTADVRGVVLTIVFRFASLTIACKVGIAVTYVFLTNVNSKS